MGMHGDCGKGRCMTGGFIDCTGKARYDCHDAVADCCCALLLRGVQFVGRVESIITMRQISELMGSFMLGSAKRRENRWEKKTSENLKEKIL